MYSLEDNYARELGAYSEALTIAPSHNYYMGREEADITLWIEYFCGGEADSFERLRQRAREAAGTGELDKSELLCGLDPRQRKALKLFLNSDTITSGSLEGLVAISRRAGGNLLAASVESGCSTDVSVRRSKVTSRFDRV